MVEIENLSYAFGDELGVIENLNLSVSRGEFVSLLGPSGCGKSTLFKIILGLLGDYKGSCLVEGVEARSYAKPIAYKPQKDLLLPWYSVYENIALPLSVKGVSKDEYDSYIDPLLEDFGLKGFENFYPKNLSGGMAQRVSLMRSYLIDSELLLLDEPFGALDAMTRARLQEWLKNIHSKYQRTVIFITHDEQEAIKLSDKVVRLSERPCRII